MQLGIVAAAVRNKYGVLARDLHVNKEDIMEMEQRMTSKDLSLEATTGEQLTHLDLLQQGGWD